MSYDESSCSDSDSEFNKDMEAFKRAMRFVTGVDGDLPKSSAADVDYDSTCASEEEDIELLDSIRQRFSVPNNDIGTEQEPISTKPLQTILPSDENDDFETLRAIQRRFSQYDDSMNTSMESYVQRSEQVGATNNIDLGKESSPNIFVKRNNNGRGFPDCVDGRATKQNLDISNDNANVSEPGSELVAVIDGGFPQSAQAFVEAIKKNRTCQKLLRDKLAKIQARMEENRKLRERVKIMKDFQTACRKRTGRALSQKKDARIQLISIPKKRVNASKIKDKNTHAINQGPAENSHVEHYRDAVSKYPFSLTREPWSKEEKENLLKGIKQQFQKMLMDNVNLLSGEDADPSCWVSMVAQIKDHKITCEEIKSFLKDVRWNELASMYFTARSGPECESRWRNCEDPSINHGPWTVNEDKKLLHIVSNRGISNWIEIAMELKTNRTPFQCLSRFQRSLNASIIKNEWTPYEDEELRKAVAEYGETNWQLVASTLEGRTGTQCSNRWKKSLNPLRKIIGKWDPDEDKRLKIAVWLFGANNKNKNYNKIAKFVPGRTQAQCRERWVNCLDPCLNMKEWTEEEDLKLKKALEEHEYCWSRIAACIPPRTDSQCRRRWKVLFPEEVHMLKVARSMKRAAFISNFVDREGERPDLTIKDFVPPLQIESDPKANEDHTISNRNTQRTVLKKRSRRARKVTCTDEDVVVENNGHVDITINGAGPTSFVGDNSETIKRTVLKRRARKVTRTEKVFKSTDEDDVAENNGHVDITNNDVGPPSFDGDNLETKKRGVPKIRSRRARQVTHTEKVLRLMDEDDNDGFLDNNNNNVEENRTFDGDEDCEIQRKATGKRKWIQRDDDEEEVVVGGGNSKKKKEAGRDCEVERRGGAELKVYFRRRVRKPRDESNIEELEDEETLGCFLNKLKKLNRGRNMIE